MKNFSRFSILAAVLMAFAGSAVAVDFPFNATVDIVTGFEVTETQGLNFGVLAQEDGDVVIAADDGVYSGDPIVFDDTNIAQGVFTVTAPRGADIQVECRAGIAVAGLAIADFTGSWDGGAEADAVVGTPLTYTTPGGSSTSELEIGATLTVTAATVSLGTAVEIPYILDVTFQ
jgi:hypothetical protein